MSLNECTASRFLLNYGLYFLVFLLFRLYMYVCTFVTNPAVAARSNKPLLFIDHAQDVEAPRFIRRGAVETNPFGGSIYFHSIVVRLISVCKPGVGCRRQPDTTS